MSNPWKKIEPPVVQNLSEIMFEQYKKKQQHNEDIDMQIHDQCASISGNISLETNYFSKKALEINYSKIDNVLKSEDNNNKNLVEKLSNISCDIVHPENGPHEPSEDESIVSAFDENIEDYVCLPKGYIPRCEEANKKENVVSWKKLNAVFDELQNKISISYYLRAKYDKELWRQEAWYALRNEPKIMLNLTSHYQLDVPMRLIFFSLITNRVLEDIDNLITIGSKCLIIYANGNTLCTKHAVPKECVVKVFMSRIRNHYKSNVYINDRSSFPQKSVACKWAENEKQNIIEMQKIGLNCPEIVCLKKYVLVVSFVGKNKKSALTLDEVKLDSKDWQRVYDEIVEAIYKLYNSAHMVYRDFNPDDILWWEEKCWFVDVSQVVTAKHYYCTKYLHNYCDSIFQFFKSKATNIMTARQMCMHVTGFDAVCDNQTTQ